MSERLIEGSPYHAEFIPCGEDERGSYAIALVKPPFDVSRAKRLLEVYVLPDVQVREVASTESTTALDIRVSSADALHGAPDKERLGIAYNNLKSVIEQLNKIESGTWKGWED